MNQNKPRYFEYTSAAVPVINKLEPKKLSPSNNDQFSNTPYTSPNMYAFYIILKDKLYNQDISMTTSNVYYILQGSGTSTINTVNNNFASVFPEDKIITWNKGDIFTIPYANGTVSHKKNDNCEEEIIIFTVNDLPLMMYLNCKPSLPRFKVTYYNHEEMMKEIEKYNSQENATKRNRNGILLSNYQMIEEKLNTLTHSMWSLLNVINGNTIQKPHRHNSIAIDLCTEMNDDDYGKIYTLMGENIDDDGNIIEPVKMLWKKNCTFTTPPGWWHSHHNESDNPAWVFPVQDAGLHTYFRTLDIQFK